MDFMPTPDACFWKMTASRIPDPESITKAEECFQEFLDDSFIGTCILAEFFDHTGSAPAVVETEAYSLTNK